MSERIEVKVPDIGDFADVEVIDVMVKAGDAVATEDPLITLESDKAAMDIPAPQSGTVVSVHVGNGDKVSEGTTIVTLEPDATETAAPAETETTEPAPAVEPPTSAAPEVPAPKAPPTPVGQLPPIDEASFSQAHASPSVRKFARELAVDLARVVGRGQKHRITTEDVKAFIKSVMSGAVATGPKLPEVPKVDFAKFGPIETEPLTRIQKISGPRLQAAWINLPHVTQHDEADITELEVLRKQLKPEAAEQGLKLTPLAFLVKASVVALKEYPRVNSSLADDGEHLVLKQYFHIGFAADTPNGLVVPVLKDADKKTLFEIAGELGALSAKAREGKLPPTDMQGGTFTISSLGGIGGTAFTPIVNAPEVAILGVSRSQMKPVWDGQAFQPRLMLPLSLSYDHRVIDGALAVRFTTFLADLLSRPDELTD